MYDSMLSVKWGAECEPSVVRAFVSSGLIVVQTVSKIKQLKIS
jgi:hypothetical protein